MEIGPLRPEDLPGALALSTQAGWNQTEEDWRRLLELSPEGCFAGRLDGRVVATATSAAPAPGVQWIGMVLVDRELRGRGFGMRILERAVEHAKASGRVGLDATDLGRPLYLKMGFHDVAPLERWGGVLPDSPGDVRRTSIDRVLALDRAALGLDRSALLRRMSGEPGVELLEGGGGYALLRPGRTASHLGPVVAEDPGPLLDAAGRLLRGAPLLVDVLRSRDAFTARGLEPRRKLMRMTWQSPQPLLLSATAAVAFEWA